MRFHDSSLFVQGKYVSNFLTDSALMIIITDIRPNLFCEMKFKLYYTSEEFKLYLQVTLQRNVEIFSMVPTVKINSVLCSDIIHQLILTFSICRGFRLGHCKLCDYKVVVVAPLFSSSTSFCSLLISSRRSRLS